MRYNTGNPVEPDGSSDPRDLYDTTGNIDLFANGSNPSYLDRLGRARKSIRGMEQDFSDFLANSGFEPVHLVYVDGQPLTVNRPTQLIDRDGRTYRVKFPAAFPVTLVGTWATDLTKLVEIDDQALRQDLASAEGYDQIGATLPTGVVSTVKGFFNWILDRITLSTSGSAGLVAAIAKGGRVVIKNGGHYLLPADGGAICDYAVDPEVGFAGNPSKRIDLSGETPGGSIISNQTNDFAVTLQGSYLPNPPHVTQNFGGFDRVGNFTIVGPSVTTPVTTDVGGSGLRIAIKANTEIHSFTAINLRRGIVLEDVLTSTLQDVNIIGCYRGITAKADNGISAPNAMSWRRVRVHGCAEHGVVSDLGSASHLDVLTSEGNGTMGTGSNSVWFTAQAQQTAGMTVITAWYSELNSGSTDFRFDNNSTHQQVIKFNGGMFQRATPTAYVGTCIYANSIGGRSIIYLDSVSFRSDFGYAPSSTRPYWDVGPYSEVIWNETCVFSETTSLVYWLCLYRPYSFTVAADGTILSGPPGFGITALGSGLYRIYRTTGRADFAKFADDVSVEITPGVGGFTGYCPAKTTATIDIQLHNGAAPANAKFDLTIRRNTGFYA